MINEQDNQESNNQQPMIENSVETESLSDLPLTGAPAEAIKGGPDYTLTVTDTATGFRR